MAVVKHRGSECPRATKQPENSPEDPRRGELSRRAGERCSSTGCMGPTPLPGRRARLVCGDASCRGPLYMALESGVVNVEGKAMLVPTEGGLILLHEGAADTKFDVVVPSGDVDRLQLVPVYPCRWAHHVVLLCMSGR